MAEMFRCMFSQGIASQVVSVVGLVVLLLSIAQVSRILAVGCVSAIRSWALAIRYARRAARARAEARRRIPS